MKIARNLSSIPNDRILDWSILKAFADEKIYVAEIMIYLSDRVENMGKEETAGYQHFFRFPQCFFKAFSQRVVKSGLCGKENLDWERVFKMLVTCI